MWESVAWAMLWGVAEGLGFSGSGCAIAGRVLTREPTIASYDASLWSLGAALGLFFTARQSWFAVIGAGLRAASRPVLFQEDPAARLAPIAAVATTAASLVALGLDPFVSGWRFAPLASGAGLLVSAIAFASTAVAPKGDLDRPTLVGAGLAGAALGFAALPGASWLGLGVVALCWLRIEREELAELALLCATPTMAIASIKGLATAPPTGLSWPGIAAGLLASAVGAALSVRLLLRVVASGSMGWLAAMCATLALSLLGFAHASGGAGVLTAADRIRDGARPVHVGHRDTQLMDQNIPMMSRSRPLPSQVGA